jgi:hypothetical protein
MGNLRAKEREQRYKEKKISNGYIHIYLDKTVRCMAAG